MFKSYRYEANYSVEEMGQYQHVLTNIAGQILFFFLSSLAFGVAVGAYLFAVNPSIVALLALLVSALSSAFLLLRITFSLLPKMIYVIRAVLDNNLSAAKEKLLGIR